MPYDPSDNDDDCVEFEVEKIEQMQVKFVPCDCEDGTVSNGIHRFTCPKCSGCGEISKEVKGENM